MSATTTSPSSSSLGSISLSIKDSNNNNKNFYLNFVDDRMKNNEAMGLPMNKSEPTFTQSTDEKYTADFIGKHDHGSFSSPQQRGSAHETTLRFVEWAREQCSTLLTSLSPNSNNSNTNNPVDKKDV
jgi:hypothetical protein